MASGRKAYLVGGGIGSLAAAAFLIRDGGLKGSDITVYEMLPILGGSLDGAGSASDGYSMRGGRMLTTDNYECTWGLFKTIPSLEHPGLTVFEETIAFNERVRSHSKARLIDRDCAILDVTSMGFSMNDRLELLSLSVASEERLGATRITDWLSPSFFETKFWYMWATTFAFQPWHSAVEFRRYLHRFIKEFSRIETLAGVKRTVYNQYDSLVRPLAAWLEERGVHFARDTLVTDLVLAPIGGKSAVSRILLRHGEAAEAIDVGPEDLVFFQNGSMTDASSLGSMTSAPPHRTKHDSGGWALWEGIAWEVRQATLRTNNTG
ncbi:oleate hydratase, partial [Blastomonas sp. CCH9-F3]